MIQRCHIFGVCIAILFFVLMLSTPLQAALPAEQRSRVIIFNSYHPYYLWSDNEILGIVETLQKAGYATEPIVEYLDCKFFSKMEHFPHLKELFKHKFSPISIPLVIAADNPALEFVLKFREELFPLAPIVFCGINGYNPGIIAGQKRITGVAERLDTRGTVEQMLSLHPGTREIFVIHDFTTTGLATRREAEQDLKEFAGKVKIRFMEDLTTDEMLQQLRVLQKGTLVLSLSYSRDREGRVFDHTKISALLGEHSPVPVYGTHEERLGFGIVGGSLLGGKHHAVKAAQMSVEILRGRDADAIPVFIGTTSRLMFDYNQLVRFSIPLSRIPAGSIIINRPVTFYEKYTMLVWVTAGVFFSLTVIIALLAVNVTQKRRAARELAAKAAELEKSNAELQEFNMLAYHDFQEPLRIISGFVQLLQKRYQGRFDSEADEYIDLVVQNVTYLKQLFTDFLNYVQVGKNSFDCTRIDVGQVLQKVVSDFHEEIEGCHAVVTIGDMPLVKADITLAAQLFRHLLSNALKFRSSAPRIVIAGVRQADKVVFSVADNGIGIEPRHQEKIFQVFKRLHGRTEYPGTGVGLSLCRRIAELHGGTLRVESTPGKGATFFVTLPAAE